jgi:Capsule polysaccharide export protein
MVERVQDHSAGKAPNAPHGVERSVAAALSATARKLRFSTSRRSSLYKAVGLRPRLADRIFKWAIVLLTVMLLVVPTLGAVIYFGFLAADQFESETRFTVRASTPALGKDQIAKVSGIPSAKIAQDTQIVANFITSPQIIASLQDKIDIRGVYRSDLADFWARLGDEATSEDLQEYWEDMVTVSISPSSGIVTTKLRAFTPQEAQDLLHHVVSAAEAMVNNLNDRIWNDVIETARANLETAASLLQTARERLQQAQNQSGVLSVDSSAAAINTLLQTSLTEVLELQKRYDVQLSSVSPEAPQMKVLAREIASKREQIEALRAQLAGSQDDKNLANVSVDMSQLQLEQSVAEQHFSSSVRALEQVQFVSKQQLVYLDAFLDPTLPDEATYPRRLLWILAATIGSLILWALSLGLLSVVRNNLH